MQISTFIRLSGFSGVFIENRVPKLRRHGKSLNKINVSRNESHDSKLPGAVWNEQHSEDPLH